MKAAGQDASRKKKDIGKTEEIPRGKTMTLEYKTWKLWPTGVLAINFRDLSLQNEGPTQSVLLAGSSKLLKVDDPTKTSLVRPNPHSESWTCADMSNGQIRGRVTWSCFNCSKHGWSFVGCLPFVLPLLRSLFEQEDWDSGEFYGPGLCRRWLPFTSDQLLFWAEWSSSRRKVRDAKLNCEPRRFGQWSCFTHWIQAPTWSKLIRPWQDSHEGIRGLIYLYIFPLIEIDQMNNNNHQ